MKDVAVRASAHSAMAMSSAEVFPPDPPVAVLRGGLEAGVPSYDAVIAEHVPLLPGGDSCRACGFVYTDPRVCPALILAADREFGALCEQQWMAVRLDVIGVQVTADLPSTKRQRR